MAYRTGNNIIIAHGTGSTFGTADAITTGDKLIVDSFSHNLNPEELTETGIGSGADLPSDASQGGLTPTIGVTKTLYFNDAGWQAVANFFQGESVTGNANGYTHSFMHGGFNLKYLTTVATYASNSVLEAASGAVTKLSMSFNNPPNYAKMTYEILCNNILYSGTTNSYATVAAATLANTRKVFSRANDRITLNGAIVPITSIEYSLTKEQAPAREMKNQNYSITSGNATPIPSGDPPFQGTVTINFVSLDDHTYFSAAAADSIHTLIGLHSETSYFSASNSSYYMVEWRFPALKLIQQPSADFNSGGVNPLSLTYKVVLASSVPSGMYTTYPHVIVLNDKSAVYFT